jgi:hypothetical protein
MCSCFASEPVDGTAEMPESKDYAKELSEYDPSAKSNSDVDIKEMHQTVTSQTTTSEEDMKISPQSHSAERSMKKADVGTFHESTSDKRLTEVDFMEMLFQKYLGEKTIFECLMY